MNCEKCGGKGDVVDSRAKGDAVWRRQKCRGCYETWTTMEVRNLSDREIQRLMFLLSTASIDIDQVYRSLKAFKSRTGKSEAADGQGSHQSPEL